MAGLTDELKQLGYDINHIENLTFIPCTLQGACHLLTQLHRGNHTATEDIESDPDGDNDDDKHHPKGYHDKIKALIAKKFPSGFCELSKNALQKEMNRISVLVVGKINKHLYSLTDIHKNFKLNKNGCCGVDSIPDAKKNSSEVCPVERNHMGRQGLTQRTENISMEQGKYILKVKQ